MSLKKFNKFYVLLAIVVVFIIAFYFSKSTAKVYGNNKDSIVQVIRSIDGYKDGSINILEVKDLKGQRFVGFLINNQPAYIEFKKNEDSNYEWKYIEKRADESFVPFLIKVGDIQSEVQKFMVITNEENKIAKLELGVNDQVIDQDFLVNKPSATWIDLPKRKVNSYTFTYKYFDQYGKQITDH